jgi:methylation protein EvaC
MKTGKYKTRKTCRLCQSRNITKILDLGFMPHAGDFLNKKDIGREKSYPLRIFYCKDCSLIQICDVPDAGELFRNYKYASSYSLKDYFFDYAQKLSKIIKKGSFIVEIGSNDGVLLSPLSKLGYKVLGVDPAKNIAKIAAKRGVATLPEYFNYQTAKKIIKKYGQADAFLASNVLAHIDDMDSVARGVKSLLKKDGIFVFEVHYLPDLIKKFQYDFFYNEHLCYYLVNPLKKFWQKYGLTIYKIEKTKMHMGTIRVYVKNADNNKIKIDSSIGRFLQTEKREGFLKIKKYLDFAKKVESHKLKFAKYLTDVKSKTGKIVGYGASGRANTILNYCGTNSNIIEYIVDESPLRSGKFTPGSHIPIKSLDYFKKDKKVKYCVLFAESYKEEILSKNQAFIKRGGKFILPLEII